MINKAITLILFLSYFVLNAQPSFIWAKQFSGYQGGIGSAIAVDKLGNSYTTGFFQGTMDFDPGTATKSFSASSYDAFITKMDNAGNLTWSNQIGGAGDQGGRTLTIGKNGDVFVTGFVNAGVSYFSKISPSGNFIWTKQIAAYNIFSIGTDSLDNIYATGTFDYTKDFDPSPAVYNLTARGHSDIFILKLDSNGIFQWVKQIGGNYTSEQCYSIAVDKDGSVYASGNFSGTAYFGPVTGLDSLIANGGQDIFIFKLNAIGDFVWQKQIGGPSNETNYTLALGPNNSLALMGIFSGTVDVDPGVGNYNLSSNLGNTFMCSFDTTGQLNWAKQFSYGSLQGGSCAGYDIAFDSEGNIIAAGVFGFTVDFDLGVDTFYLSTSYPVQVFIAKYDGKGNFICAGQIEATNVSGITSDPFGAIISIGQFDGTPDFDPGNAVYSLNYAANSDIFISKWACGVVTKQFEAADAFNSSLSVFPNPSTGVVEIRYYQPGHCDLILKIYDSQGRIIINEFVEKLQGDWKKQINFSEYSKGLYLLEMTADDVKTMKKIVVD